MDRSQIYENIPMLVLLASMVSLQLPIDPAFKQYIFWGGFVGCFLAMFTVEYTFRLKASEYLYIEAICRPSNQKLHLFIKEPAEGVHSRLIDPIEQIYETPVELGEKTNHKYYGNISRLDLKHDLTWEERMIFMPGTAFFKGYPVRHNKTARVILWEPQGSKGRIDFLEAVPKFWIAEAPRDWHLMVEPPTLPQAITANGGQIISVDTQLALAEYEDMKRENQLLLDENRDLKSDYFNEHQLRIRLHGEVEELQNEFKGALSRVRDVSKLVLEELLTVLSAHTEIVEAVKEYKPFQWFKITRNIVILVLGLAFIGAFVLDEGFQHWVTANQPFLIILAIVAGGIVYYTYAKGR